MDAELRSAECVQFGPIMLTCQFEDILNHRNRLSRLNLAQASIPPIIWQLKKPGNNANLWITWTHWTDASDTLVPLGHSKCAVRLAWPKAGVLTILVSFFGILKYPRLFEIRWSRGIYWQLTQINYCWPSMPVIIVEKIGLSDNHDTLASLMSVLGSQLTDPGPTPPLTLSRIFHKNKDWSADKIMRRRHSPALQTGVWI